MKRRVLSVLLAAMMCSSLLAGCGNEKNSSSGSSENAGDSKAEESSEQAEDSGQTDDSEQAGIIAQTGIQPGDYSEPLTITVWMLSDNYEGYYTSYGENPVVDYLEKKFNVTLEFQQPVSGSESEQFNLMLGTGEYTDVFSLDYSNDTTATLYNDRVIQDLSPYLEAYAPTYLKYLTENEVARKTGFDEEGRVFSVPNAASVGQLMWGGLVYRRDILETMTGGNVAFPSGNEDPSTIEDWEYMLELMKQYFEAAQMADYACFILPSNGYFGTSEMLNGFGTSGDYFIEDGKVQYGPLTDGFYNYLVKMAEWYEKGYIYKDFASRTQDMFFLPNTALTYGGAAGAWYGMNSQLGEDMSIPEYGLYFDVCPIASPLDTATTDKLSSTLGMVQVNNAVGTANGGFAVSVKCSEEKLIRWMQICDYLFTEEGGMLKGYGLNAEQAADSEVYQSLGLTNGAYSLEDGKVVYDERVNPFSEAPELNDAALRGMRLPGLNIYEYYNDLASDTRKHADEVWCAAGYAAAYPTTATMNVEEQAQYNSSSTAVSDYVDSMVPQFIMGTSPITEESFEAFKNQLIGLGVENCIAAKQSAYDRDVAR